VSLWFERSKTPAWGILGGRAGRPPEISIEGPQIRMSPLKLKARAIAAGTLVRTMTGGGGGYGASKERPPLEVLADVIDGYVTVDGARRDYGVVIDPERLAVDEAATQAERSSH
jgi:N-methylhydantoinase B